MARRIEDMVRLALLRLGVYAPGQPIDDADAQIALDTLSLLRASWAGTYIDPIRFDKTVFPSGNTMFLTCGSIVDPQDSTPVENVRRIHLKIKGYPLESGDIISTSINGTALADIPFEYSREKTTQDWADEINSANLGVTASILGEFHLLLTSDYDIGTLVTVASANSHTVEYTGDLDVRPADIEQVILLYGGVNVPLKIKSYEEFRQLPVQTIVALPQTAYVDVNYPIQNIYLFPGIGAGNGIRVQGSAYLKDYTSLSDNYQDAPELFQPMMLHLAIQMCPVYGREVPQGELANAHASLKAIKARNFVSGIQRQKNDFGNRNGTFNFWAGV